MSVRQTIYDNSPDLDRDLSKPLRPRHDYVGGGVLSGILERGPKAKAAAIVGSIALVGVGLGGRDIAARFAEVAHPHTVTHIKKVQVPGSLAGSSGTQIVTTEQQVIGGSGK